MPRTVTIENVDVVAETDQAICISIFYENPRFIDEVWIPRSQISDDSDVSRDAVYGDYGSLTITEWIAIQKDLI